MNNTTSTSTSTSTAAPASWRADSPEANETARLDWRTTETVSSRGETQHRFYSAPHRLVQLQIFAIDNDATSRTPDEGAEAWRAGWLWLPLDRHWSSPTAADIETRILRWFEDEAEKATDAGQNAPDDVALYVRTPTAPDALPWHRGEWFYFGTYDADNDPLERADEISVCDDCGETVWADATETVNGGDRVGNNSACGCLDSYVWCSDCGTYYHENDDGAVIDGEYVCSNCLRSGEYFYHEGAGEWSTEPPDNDEDDDHHQGPCPMPRYSYHTDANATLQHRIPQTGHTFGCELEYKGSPGDWAAVAEACRNRAILTNDSTVSGELVSVALTAGQLRRWIAATATALAGTRNDSATGMHLHVDRRALSPWQWFTLTHYIKHHASTVETIAGRQSNQWSNLRELPAEDWPTFARRWQSRSWPSRYTGINLSKGPTVEVRCCRATKTAARALARFGLIQRLTALGRLAPSQRPETAEELRGWLAQDQHIAAITGWEPGAFNYRQALNMPTDAARDQPPTPPSAEQILALRDEVRRLDADYRLTEQLRYNAARQLQAGIQNQAGSAWETDTMARLYHYRNEGCRINRLLDEARAELSAAESLRILQ